MLRMKLPCRYSNISGFRFLFALLGEKPFRTGSVWGLYCVMVLADEVRPLNTMN